jgi:plasmid stability protein
MPDLTIHDVPAEELAALSARAARHGRSVEDEVKHLVREAAAEESLLQELERATRAVDARLGATHEPGPRPAPRRRSHRFEPTPRGR